MERLEATGKQVIVAWATECKATHKDVSYLQSDHEEADTKIILHALDATAASAMELSIHSADTDVRRYPDMFPNTSFVTGSATHCTIKLQPTVEALGSAKTAELPAFHALTGLITRVLFSAKGKPTCWKELKRPICGSLANLDRDEKPNEETLDGIEQFVCQYERTTS